MNAVISSEKTCAWIVMRYNLWLQLMQQKVTKVIINGRDRKIIC